MIGKRNHHGLLLDQSRKVLVKNHSLDHRVPFTCCTITSREKESRGGKLDEISDGGIGHDDLLLGKATLNSLLQQFRDGTVSVNSNHAHLYILIATHVQQRIEKCLLGLLAKRGEMVQNEKERNIADLSFLQDDFKELHVFKLCIFKSLVYTSLH